MINSFIPKKWECLCARGLVFIKEPRETGINAIFLATGIVLSSSSNAIVKGFMNTLT